MAAKLDVLAGAPFVIKWRSRNFRSKAISAPATRPSSSLISRQFCHISIAAHIDNGFPAKFNIVPFRRLDTSRRRHFLQKAAGKKKRALIEID